MCDLIAADLPRIGGPGDLIYAPRGIQLRVGGHAANVSIDLAQLEISDVAVAGCVGDDVLGRFIEGELRRRGLEVFPERLRGVHTGKNLVIDVRGEDRRFFAELAANTLLSPEHVFAVIEDVRPELFYQGTVGGLRFVDGRVDNILGRVGEMGCLSFVDVVPPQDRGWGKLRESLPLIDVFHCNGFESALFTGERDPMVAAEALVEGGAQLCLITLGSEGLIAAYGEGGLKMPSFNVISVDPTGAGDAFSAGVMEALIVEKIDRESLASMHIGDFRSILLNGAAAGAVCVTSVGATTAVTRREVDQLIREQGDVVWESVELI